MQPLQIRQNHRRLRRTSSDHMEQSQIMQSPHQILQKHLRSCRTNSDYTELAQITQNSFRSRRTSSNHIQPSQVAQNNHRSRSTHSNHGDLTIEFLVEFYNRMEHVRVRTTEKSMLHAATCSAASFCQQPFICSFRSIQTNVFVSIYTRPLTERMYFRSRSELRRSRATSIKHQSNFPLLGPHRLTLYPLSHVTVVCIESPPSCSHAVGSSSSKPWWLFPFGVPNFHHLHGPASSGCDHPRAFSVCVSAFISSGAFPPLHRRVSVCSTALLAANPPHHTLSVLVLTIRPTITPFLVRRISSLGRFRRRLLAGFNITLCRSVVIQRPYVIPTSLMRACRIGRSVNLSTTFLCHCRKLRPFFSLCNSQF